MRHFTSDAERQAFLDGLAEAEELCQNSLYSQAAALIRVVASVQRKTWGLDNGVAASSGAASEALSGATSEPRLAVDWLAGELMDRLTWEGCQISSRVESAMRTFKTKKDFMDADAASFLMIPNCGKRTAKELEMIQGVLIQGFKAKVAF